MLVVAGNMTTRKVEESYKTPTGRGKGKGAGVNARALPALAATKEADGGGTGSLSIAMDGASGLREAYESHRFRLPQVGRFRGGRIRVHGGRSWVIVAMDGQ